MESLISEDEFKILIQRNDKKNRKNIEITQIITLCNTAVTDIIYRFCDYLKKCEINEYNLDTYTNELTEIRNYCNNILKDIAFTYGSTQYKFDANFNFKPTEKEKKIKEDKKSEA